MTDSRITQIDTDDLEPHEGLRAVVAFRRLADRLEDYHVARAIREGWSWARIAEALNVTRQAVHKKHAARLRAAGIISRRSSDV
jgi:DNA-binding NarL/FixJ family response regulator